MTNIRIKAVDIYHPKTVRTNDFYLKHFAEKGKDISRFLKMMGRESRYIIEDKNENGLTMAIEATKRVLRQVNMSGEEMDMIVFSTQTPEYTFPTNAILVHKEIQGKAQTICMDSNSNCAGMLVAVEQTCRYMMSNPNVKHALVVGSDHNSIHCNPDDEITYPNYGDASSAIILEKVEENTGFIDSMYYTDSKDAHNILFPACGLSNIYNPENKPKDMQINWIPFDGTVCVPPAVSSIKSLLTKHGLEKEDIGSYCFSQFSLKNIEVIQEKLGEDKHKFVYVGDEFGYTGTSSPFIALYKGIQSGKIKRGDHVVFWSVGTGWQIITMLFKY
ncbi:MULTISPECIES: ketoacyl-ACP synthase III [Bacillus cereus group]|uniref:3-oxoacyl-ACP synthase n=1 Tax=Bacillus cereus TaxID=1396 RepID=A0A9X6VV75_BACCE|nr:MULTISPECIES: 3-oxoacyl-ACP synthase III family protein [Bacillus cereus group]PFF46036.1 3-oxoacyl-ACP synthase [Bacillus cereus]PFQ36491.1 3-oxoacyl-ACP synthase [Bacillus cereus]PGB17889.1 3-oxoacyl-ACP synthase [Bacillus toyonensis]